MQSNFSGDFIRDERGEKCILGRRNGLPSQDWYQQGHRGRKKPSEDGWPPSPNTLATSISHRPLGSQPSPLC